MNKESIVPLSFIIELLNPPMRHRTENTNKLFSELKDIYTNCNRPADNITELSSINQTTQEIKRCIVRGNKIIILNDFTSYTLQSFWKTSSDVLKKAINILQIPLFFFRQYTVRLAATPLKEKDSRVFLGSKVCGFEDSKLKRLGRPMHGCGIRFVFPRSRDNQSEYTIRVESLLKDIGQIFLENQARFFVPIQLQGNYLENIKEELNKTYSFLKENVSDFLVQYNE